MNKKKTIIIITYLLTLVIFITIAELNIDNFVRWYMETMDYGNVLIALGPIVIATVLHVLITVIIAIIVRFIKNIDKDVKKINNSDIKKWWKTTEHFFSNEANLEDLHM